MRRNDGVAVTEFATVIDFDGEACQALDDELAGKPCVPACSTRNGLNLLELTEIRFRDIDFIEKHAAAFLPDAADQGVFHRARLLKDFFEHEMLVAAFFRGNRI